MSLWELIALAVGLSMDAFAVSICKGLSIETVSNGKAAVVGLYFGLFQMGMPLLGYLLGSRFSVYISSFDHWIAFILLGFIGGKMIKEALSKEEEGEVCPTEGIGLELKELLLLAVATSIDALAVGITFAFLNYPIIQAVSIIGILTFVIAVAGVYIGNIFGNRYKKRAELAGGIILVLIGLKILIEHLRA